MSNNVDTIVAQATAPLLGAVGIVRISGKAVCDIARSIIGVVPTPRIATLVNIQDPHKGMIDTGLALFFPGPHSFTGEDVLELQCHGGLVILDMIVKACVEMGARIAKPGEFSERAFLNDKIDLCQAEAIADLIHATTEQAVKSAHRSLCGAFSDEINKIQNALTELRVYVEAAIDFVEEEIDFLSDGKILISIERLLSQIIHLLKVAEQGQLLQEGNKVVIAGKPNVGKSSLFNMLAQNNSAIVTDIPGTTRDIIKETIQINGVPIHLLDTAGIRNATDAVEEEGIKRAKEQFKLADTILLVIDASQKILFTEVEQALLAEYKEKTIVLLNKMDLIAHAPEIDVAYIALSIKNGVGMDVLHSALTKHAHSFEGVFSARRRHVDAIKSAKENIQNAQVQLVNFKAGELVAEELRQAQLHLGEITGQLTSDDLLGKIFSTFCVGK
ncbi:tRNA uridine-5-carboxymethylaminomethyl(34) synthesis GTPase MnmE [Candidatus Berkiella cookevillensis]|uniref:tRNA modification GTPase MnmE n=1 Tax=Candidatus Berkiella cookevillensis TaxID=437022 RepID=A0A0Q9YE56_9GAMM|nr:tRNA uridine-5-carboxymethylaminomethyl(34) synthesis GTPase MnmE [Candidatus Berkiella cookevillensis]MCS5709730.1 tRNA uridine-5-carboxymethylaminomethyl(34) synthesis GTPase MnmE [Candidatus Berkiella cookevillensis]